MRGRALSGLLLLLAVGVISCWMPNDLLVAGPVDRANVAWMLTATALVLMMTIPGLALFYGGMVRKKT